jgi:hypothetical protein
MKIRLKRSYENAVNLKFLGMKVSLVLVFLLSLLAEHRASFQRFLGLEVCIL